MRVDGHQQVASRPSSITFLIALMEEVRTLHLFSAGLGCMNEVHYAVKGQAI